MPRPERYPRLREAAPVPATCPKCTDDDIRGPFFTLKRDQSKAGRVPALVVRTYFCRRCWHEGNAVFELDIGQPMPLSAQGVLNV